MVMVMVMVMAIMEKINLLSCLDFLEENSIEGLFFGFSSFRSAVYVTEEA